MINPHNTSGKDAFNDCKQSKLEQIYSIKPILSLQEKINSSLSLRIFTNCTDLTCSVLRTLNRKKIRGGSFIQMLHVHNNNNMTTTDSAELLIEVVRSW